MLDYDFLIQVGQTPGIVVSWDRGKSGVRYDYSPRTGTSSNVPEHKQKSARHKRYLCSHHSEAHKTHS
jgi:hypothetical protein